MITLQIRHHRLIFSLWIVVHLFVRQYLLQFWSPETFPFYLKCCWILRAMILRFPILYEFVDCGLIPWSFISERWVILERWVHMFKHLISIITFHGQRVWYFLKIWLAIGLLVLMILTNIIIRHRVSSFIILCLIQLDLTFQLLNLSQKYHFHFLIFYFLSLRFLRNCDVQHFAF